MDMPKNSFLFLFGLHLFFLVKCADNTLVLLDNLAMKETYSIFFKTLVDRGFNLQFNTVDDPDVTLVKHGKYLFDHLILFSHSINNTGEYFHPEDILGFIDAGGNVLVGMDSNSDSSIRELANECGFDIEEGSSVIDHINFDVKDDAFHTLLVTDAVNLIKEPHIVGSRNISPILFRGIGISKYTNCPLTLDILTASPTAYCFDLKNATGYPFVIGKDILLISALQAANNARIVFSGSLEFFSNHFLDSQVQGFRDDKKYDKSGNQLLTAALTKWLFKETGFLRIGKVSHHRKGKLNSMDTYTIKDDVVYSIEIEILKDGKWVFYESDDVQVEFSRTEPYVRMPLRRMGNAYTAEFKLPDVCGVYHFKVDYYKKGYTHIYSAVQVAVRPLKHNEYERFIFSAYPYYLSSFSMMFSFFIFSFIFLYSTEDIKIKNE